MSIRERASGRGGLAAETGAGGSFELASSAGVAAGTSEVSVGAVTATSGMCDDGSRDSVLSLSEMIQSKDTCKEKYETLQPAGNVNKRVEGRVQKDTLTICEREVRGGHDEHNPALFCLPPIRI